MRFLALEMNIGRLKRQFIAEGEEEILTVNRHSLIFLLTLLWVVPLTVGVLAVVVYAMAQDLLDSVLLAIIFYTWLIIAFLFVLRAFIAWKFNYIIITTEKLVIVHNRSFFHQDIRPLHIENIQSTKTQSQFFGLGNCGTLQISLSETVDASNEQVILPYLPRPDVVAGAIENAMVLKKQRAPQDKGVEAQEQKVEEAQVKAEEQIQA